jgi:DNA polymerase IV
MLLHVDLDSFFVAVERRRNPDLAGRPVVIGGRPGSRGMVAAASREARRCGVRVGMPLAQASVRCPDGVFLDGSLDEAFVAAHQVDELLRRESPDVEWQSIDEVFVALPALPAVSITSGRKAIAIAERLHGAIADLGFDAACGVARSKLVSRIASQLARPCGVVHVLDGYEQRFLAPLKLELLPGLDIKVARRLRASGIRRLGQLAKLSDAQLTSLAGRTGPSLGRQAAGIDPTRIRRTALPPPRIEDRPLSQPTCDSAVLHAAIACEAERVGHDLRSRGVFARTVTLRVRFADGRTESRTATLKAPSALDDVLTGAAIDLLPRIWTGDRLVRAIGVSCAGLLAGTREAALFPLRHA